MARKRTQDEQDDRIWHDLTKKVVFPPYLMNRWASRLAKQLIL